MFTHLWRLSSIGVLWVISSAVAIAQTKGSSPCEHVRQTGSAAVYGYVFKTYEAVNPDDDPACLRIYRNGKIVYFLAAEEQKYFLGQPADARFKIPHVPNGVDLTGNGRPDMIVTSWSGGAHCCYTHYIFELRPKLRLLTTIDDGNSDLSHFEKLDKSLGYYYVTSDIWSYWPSSFASSVRHDKVILKWDNEKFRLDLGMMRDPPPNPQQWKAALKDVDDALKDGGEIRGALGVTLWAAALDLIYTGHSDLAWKFVREANPNALIGDNPSLEDFCTELKRDEYWPDLEPTLKAVPEECARAKVKAKE
jgi:hypothetical protein